MIDEYRTTEISVSKKASLDRYGDPSFSSSVQAFVRWEEGIQYFTDANGNNIRYDAKFFADKDLDIEVEDKVTKDDIDYKVIKVSTKAFIDDDSHKEVLIVIDES